MTKEKLGEALRRRTRLYNSFIDLWVLLKRMVRCAAGKTRSFWTGIVEIFVVGVGLLSIAYIAMPVLKRFNLCGGGDSCGAAGLFGDPRDFAAVAAIIFSILSIGVSKLRLKLSDSTLKERLIFEAIEQLGSDSPQVRVAAVHRLFGIADSDTRYIELVKNILCSYIRTTRVKGEAEYSLISSIKEQGIPEDIYSLYSYYLKCEVQVENEVVYGIVRRMRQEAGTKSREHAKVWRTLDYDFSRATFYGAVDLRDAYFEGKVKLYDTWFLQDIVTGTSPEDEGVGPVCISRKASSRGRDSQIQNHRTDVPVVSLAGAGFVLEHKLHFSSLEAHDVRYVRVCGHCPIPKQLADLHFAPFESTSIFSTEPDSSV